MTLHPVSASPARTSVCSGSLEPGGSGGKTGHLSLACQTEAVAKAGHSFIIFYAEIRDL